MNAECGMRIGECGLRKTFGYSDFTTNLNLTKTI